MQHIIIFINDVYNILPILDVVTLLIFNNVATIPYANVTNSVLKLFNCSAGCTEQHITSGNKM